MIPFSIKCVTHVHFKFPLNWILYISKYIECVIIRLCNTGRKQLIGSLKFLYISPENWLQHFKSVLQTAPSETTNAQFQSYVEASLPNLEKVAEQSEALNATITEREIHKSIKGFKSAKAVYFDEISNDTLKSGYGELKEGLTHLFNIIMYKGYILMHGVTAL